MFAMIGGAPQQKEYMEGEKFCSCKAQSFLESFDEFVGSSLQVVKFAQFALALMPR